MSKTNNWDEKCNAGYHSVVILPLMRCLLFIRLAAAELLPHT